MADDVVEIADNSTNDWMERETENGKVTVFDHEHVQRSRLRIETRRWLMGKFAPRDYGDKLEITPAAVGLQRLLGLSDEQRLQEARNLLQQVNQTLAAAREAGEVIEVEAEDVTDADPNATRDAKGT